MSVDMFLDRAEEGIDPRVQIELERLNSTTNKINKLEVDLEEARNQFRQLLRNSTCEIENCSKKLGSCITKVRPYYDARIKAKEALQKTQKAALNFEKAVSAHAAAKEMVSLAEEGLKAEGRTFDQAWQEMLNHATMRVNESETDRSKCEVEHKRTFQNYHLAEIRVLELQKELKKAIAKSRPYFEMKIQYSQLLESQKMKVKSLEKLIAESKFTYACTLRNLEQISDEIHKARERRKKSKKVEMFSNLENTDTPSNSGKDDWHSSCSQNYSKIKKDFEKDYCTQIKAELLEQQLRIHSASFGRINSFSSIDLVDTENEILKVSANLKDKRSFSQTELFSHSFANRMGGGDSNSKSYLTEYLDLCISDKNRLLIKKHFYLFPPERNKSSELLNDINDSCSSEVKFYLGNNLESSNFNSGVAEMKTNLEAQEILKTIFIKNSNDSLQTYSNNEKIKCGSNSEFFRKSDPKEKEEIFNCEHSNLKESSRNSRLKRPKFDILWNSPTSEKVKGILSQSLTKLNIGSLTEKNLGETKSIKENKIVCHENKLGESDLSGNNRVYLTDQDRANVFKQTNFIKEEKTRILISKKKPSISTSFQPRFISKKEKLFTKNISSPLEKTLAYLNADEDSNSDSDSLTSSDVLTDEQLSSLILDRDLEEIYQDII